MDETLARLKECVRQAAKVGISADRCHVLVEDVYRTSQALRELAEADAAEIAAMPSTTAEKLANAIKELREKGQIR